MDQRDQELLDKQFRTLTPPRRNDGVMILAIVSVFFAGITVGGLLAEKKSEPIRTAANDVTSAIPYIGGTPPITPQ